MLPLPHLALVFSTVGRYAKRVQNSASESMLKDWTQTICAVVALVLTCGGMLVYTALWITGTIDTQAAAQRAALTAVAAADRSAIETLTQQFQSAHMNMMDRVAKDENEVARIKEVQTYYNASVDRLTMAVSELTKELSNLEGVISDGRKR